MSGRRRSWGRGLIKRENALQSIPEECVSDNPVPASYYQLHSGCRLVAALLDGGLCKPTPYDSGTQGRGRKGGVNKCYLGASDPYLKAGGAVKWGQEWQQEC